jgi:peptidoglycan/LPS O-acetylase OafA/YrhL
VVLGEHKDRTKTNRVRHVQLNSRALGVPEGPEGGDVPAAARLDLPGPAHRRALDRRRAAARAVLAPVPEAPGHPLPQPVRDAPHLRHHDADGGHDAGVGGARQMGHSIEQFLRTYAKWIDGGRTRWRWRSWSLHDSLRGALSLTVVTAHSWQIFIHPGDSGASSPAAFVFIIAARIAVLAFFALSGYVIAASIASNIAKAGHFEADKYLIARVFRIVPPLLVIIAATVLLSAFLRAIGADHVASDYAARKVFATDAAGQLRAIVTLCTQGELTGAWLNGPLWSLTFEIRLYVVAGLVAVFCCGRGWPLRTMALLLAALFLHAIKLDNVLSKGIDLQSTSFVAFLCGAMAYRFRHVSATVLLAVVVGFLAVAAVRILQSESDILGGIDIDTMLLAAQITIGVSSAAAIALIARGAEWPVFRRAGEYSYTLYIGHVPLLLAIYFVLENGFPQALSPIVSIIRMQTPSRRAGSTSSW